MLSVLGRGGMGVLYTRDRAAIATQILAGKVRPLSDTAPHVPQPIALAIERALRRDRALRYANMTGLARSLLAAAEASSIAVPDDPDAVGLPEYRSWRAGQNALLSTVAARVPAQRAADFSEATKLAVRSDAAGAGSSARGVRAAALVIALIVLAVGVSYLLLRPEHARVDGAAVDATAGTPANTAPAQEKPARVLPAPKSESDGAEIGAFASSIILAVGGSAATVIGAVWLHRRKRGRERMTFSFIPLPRAATMWVGRRF